MPWNDENENGEREEGEYAVFNVYGDGTLIAIGGDAGDGGGAVTDNTGGRWRSDGAGARDWTEIGGKGGNANVSYGYKGYAMVAGAENSGENGGNGENCGIVSIYDTLKVFAFGGRWTEVLHYQGI